VGHEAVGAARTGLGLFIAREAALGHHGTLEVTSDAEDGTVFNDALANGSVPGKEKWATASLP
jgi:signal transduction histidine kinase